MLSRAHSLSWVAIFLVFAAGVALQVTPAAPVVITWETGSEVGTAGFNVYRASETPAASDPLWTRINPELIEARGDEVVGARYRYADHDVQPSRRYQYRIEEIEWDGATTLYPDIVLIRAGLPTWATRLEGVGFVLFALVLLRRKLRRG